MKNIEQIILEVADANNIKLDLKNKLVELKMLNIDSLAAMNLIIQIEDKTGKVLEDEKLMKIKTLDDLIKAFE